MRNELEKIPDDDSDLSSDSIAKATVVADKKDDKTNVEDGEDENSKNALFEDVDKDWDDKDDKDGENNKDDEV